MDSLILCKFLRGVFDDPWEEWAALLAPVTGWDIDGDELHDDRARHRRRQARVQPPRGLDARGGHAAGAAARRPARRSRPGREAA